MAKKTAAKTADISEDKTPATIPQPHGGALLTGGVPGNSGGTGRPPDEFKRRMAEISSSDEALAYLEECIKGTHGYKAAASARVYATEYGYGKAPSSVEISGPDGAPIHAGVVILPALRDG